MTQSSMDVNRSWNMDFFFLNKRWQLIFHVAMCKIFCKRSIQWPILLRKYHNCRKVLRNKNIRTDPHCLKAVLDHQVGWKPPSWLVMLHLRCLILPQMINHEVQACLAEEDCGCEICVFMKTAKCRKVRLLTCVSHVRHVSIIFYKL